jgi:predicted GNAT family acetyltransferase
MIKAYQTAGDFLAIAQNCLQEKEAENNLMLGLAYTLNRDIHYFGNTQPLFITVHADAKCVGACLQTPPYNLILYATETHLEKAVQELCAYLLKHGYQVPGIIGPKDTADKFNKIWLSPKKVSLGGKMSQMVYKIEKVNKIPMAEGKLRQALKTDHTLLTDWLGKFHKEALRPISIDKASEMAAKKIKEEAFYIWETDRPVSMAGWTRPTSNGVTIASVYTPEKFRHNGYASSCVARLTEKMLRDYSFCSLFTDQGNPTSNSIYQKIGYEVVDYVLQCEYQYH